MLGLQLREEFRGKRLKGTTVDFKNQSGTGALDVSASEFLNITYPSYDLVKAIESTGPHQSRPVVLLGSRGQGKSHLLAALYHLFTNPNSGEAWLHEWSTLLKNDQLANLKLRNDCFVVAESLHLHRYKFLWDILFQLHPKGQWYEAKWSGMGDKKTEIPGYDLLMEMFTDKPTVLILDEFQTWYEGLTNTKQFPWRNWAFNFIQILSEIAQSDPSKLVLVVSVREGSSDAYQQIRRVNPVDVDFKGPFAKRDRQRLLLYRIFANRMQLSKPDITKAVRTHVDECFRLAKVPTQDQEKQFEEFIESYPFAPHLLKLLDDQVLIATDAQETRDLIKILVDLFKTHDSKDPIITAADFSLTDEKSGVASLLDSVANQLHKDLREKALRNYEAVVDAVSNSSTVIPHAEKIISALWLRSLSVDQMAGAEPYELQIDITRDKPIDDNRFEVELANIVDNSFNIHRAGTRLMFRRDENARSKLLAHAKNDKLFPNGEDVEHLAKEIRAVIGGSEDVSAKYRLVVLKRRWQGDPWSELEEKEHPKNWDGRLSLVLIPDYQDKIEVALGKWLKDHMQEDRNTIRFLLPQKGTGNIYYDRELLVLARAVYLATKWKATERVYADLERSFRKDELIPKLRNRFDRFAVMTQWNFAEPSKCQFEEAKVDAQGDKIPEAVDRIVKEEVFIPEEFEEYVLKFAENSESVGKLLKDLREPRPGGKPCIPWLGEIPVKERVIRMCAEGQIAINLRGLDMLQAKPEEDAEEAWTRMKGKLGTGKHLDETIMLLPSAVTVSGGKSGVSGGGTDEPSPARTSSGSGTSPSGVGIGTTSGNGSSSGQQGTMGNLFGGSGTAPTVSKKSCSAMPTSSLNLLGHVESWGIGPATSVTSVALKIGKMSGAQLQALIKHLPDGVTYALDLEREEKS
jgi:hypothetical protein